MKQILWVLGAIAAVFGILVAVVLVRTAGYGSGGGSGEMVALPEPPAVDAEAVAARVGQALQFRTITVAPGDPRPGQEQPWLDLQAWMEATYPAAHAVMEKETVPGTLTLIYTWQGSDPSLAPLLFMAHQDVVPVNIGTEGDWTAPAFSGQIVDGYLYGRGAMDDKSSLITQLEALDLLAADGFQPVRTMIFIFGHDEEVMGAGAESAVALLKSRGIAPEMALDEGMLVLDPNPLTGKPMGLIGVAEKGYMTLVLTAEAEGGHSSTPPRDSATVRLAKALVALDENQMAADVNNPIVQGLFRAAADDLPFLQKMAMANLWLFKPMVEGEIAANPAANAMIRTTTAPTMLTGSAKENVLAQKAIALVNFRVHPNDQPEDVIEHVKKLVEPIGGITVEPNADIEGSRPSPVSSTESRTYRVLEAVASRTGDGAPVAPMLVLGATDSRYAVAITDQIYKFVPAVATPEERAGVHGTNERISVENLQRMVEGYAQIFMALSSE